MNIGAAEFVGDIPRNYDEGLGPNIFEFNAGIMANLVGELAPDALLELAAGTGIVTRRLRDALPAGSSLTATDLNQAMLDVASAKFRPGEAVVFEAADAQSLQFANNSFDALVCQFGHMFFPERNKAHAEAMRVIKPGGTYLFSTWGTMKENPFSEITHKVMAEVFEGDPPGFYAVPFSLHQPDLILSELETAGFNDVCHNVVAHTREVKDFAAFARGLVFGNPVFAEILERGGDPIAVQADVAGALRLRLGPDGSKMPLLAHFFVAKVP